MITCAATVAVVLNIGNNGDDETAPERPPVNDRRGLGSLEEYLEVADELDFEIVHDTTVFDRVVQNLSRANVANAAFNNIIREYEFLALFYDAPAHELNYLLNLINRLTAGMSGEQLSRAIEDIMQIYDFFQWTNEDIAIIEQMFNLREEYEDSIFWVENTFNRVTEGRHGVLTPEDVDEFFERGLDFYDIVLANQLSRRGIYTIRQILDRFLRGQSAAYIAAVIDGNSRNNLRISANMANISRFADIPSEEVIVARRLAVSTGLDITIFYDRLQEGEYIWDIELEHAKILNDRVMRSMEARGYPQRGEVEQLYD